ncbi:Transcription elongation factor spt6 [Linnemannia zychae]|nr:Transcription elongation factor spt6 [Linnemannia zychae]
MERIPDDENGESNESQDIGRNNKRKETVNDLDDDDLDLLEENTGLKIQRTENFKRLKKRRSEFENGDNDHDDATVGSVQSNYDPLERLFDVPLRDGADVDNTIHNQGKDDDDMNGFIDDEDVDDDDRDIIEYQLKRQQQTALRKPIAATSAYRYNAEMNEWYGVFGDGEDYAYALSRENGEESQINSMSMHRLRDVFEPGVLADKMLTKRDDAIRLMDVPERMQMRPGVKPDRILTDEEIELENYLVSTAMNNNPRQFSRPPVDSTHIQSVLKFMSQELFEVPFIDLHRQDYFTSIQGHRLTRMLSREDLWFIYDEDFKFRSFLERKEAINSLVDRVHIDDDYLDYSLLRAERIEELTDISDYINLKYSKKIDGTNANLLRRPGSVGVFDVEQREQLSAFITSFGMATRSFGTNLSKNSHHFFPETPNTSPEEAAQEYVGKGCLSTEKVITAAVKMMAQEIAVDPQVRRAIRTKYETDGCVTVTPTEKGATTIDEFHPYYPFKRMTKKNVLEFHDGQFLQILHAQSEGLLKVDIKIPDEDSYIQHVTSFYLSGGYDDRSELWDALRAKIVSIALKEYIFVVMERGTIRRLRVQAEEWVGAQCQASLEERMRVSPFKVPGIAKDEEVSPRVVAVSHGPGSIKDAIQVVFVNDRGKLTENITLDNLRDRKLQEEFLSFLERHRPDVVVVGGFSIATRRLLEQTVIITQEYRESKGDPVPVIMTNDEVARLYQSSKRGIEDYPLAFEITRYCISLARTIQNPINEYAGTGPDLIGIRLHPLQEFVSVYRLRELLDRALVNVINDVGLDINEAVSSPYKALMLPYICGLGVRKATHLISTIERELAINGGINKRSDLIHRKMLPWKIFMNCCSFLQVHTDRGGDILDETRIHVEDYNLARKMAADALEIDEEGLQNYDEESQHVEELMKDNHAEKLNELLLEDYARQLEEIQNKPRRMTLEHIKTELQHPFRDPRTSFAPATQDQIFTMLTGETDQTLREGLIVPARVVKLREKSAICRLDCGIEGILAIRNISDGRVRVIEDHLAEDQTLQVKILRIEKDRFLADLSCKESDLRGGDAELRLLPVDQTFNQQEEDKAREQEDIKNAQNYGLMPRRINHPLFKNIPADASVKHLSNKNRGELVIGPSHRGPDHLMITVKIADDIYKHYGKGQNFKYDVIELQKRDDASLGDILQIDGATYRDLDELLVTHIEAILSRIQDLMRSPKYHENEYGLKYWLEEQTKARPDNAVYGFTLSRKYPGYFSLIFKLGKHAKIDEWNIKVLPGFYQLKGPSRRDCPTVISISDNFKDMASKLSSSRRRHSKKPPPSSESGSISNHLSHRGRSQSHHRRNSVVSTTSTFSTYSRPNNPILAPSTSDAYSYKSGPYNGNSDYNDYGGYNDNFQGDNNGYSSTPGNNRARSRSRHLNGDDYRNNNNPLSGIESSISSGRARSRSRYRNGGNNINEGSLQGNYSHAEYGEYERGRTRSRYGGQNSQVEGANSTFGATYRSRSAIRDGDNNINVNYGARARSKSRVRGETDPSNSNSYGGFGVNVSYGEGNRGRSTSRFQGRDNNNDNNGFQPSYGSNNRGRSVSRYRSGDFNRAGANYQGGDGVNNGHDRMDRGRSRTRYGNRDSSINPKNHRSRSRFNNRDNASGNSYGSRARSRSRFRGSDINHNTSFQNSTEANSFPVESNMVSRHGTGASSNSGWGTNGGSGWGTESSSDWGSKNGTTNEVNESTGWRASSINDDSAWGGISSIGWGSRNKIELGSSNQQMNIQDSKVPAYVPHSASVNHDRQDLDFTAYSPEPTGSMDTTNLITPPGTSIQENVSDYTSESMTLDKVDASAVTYTSYQLVDSTRHATASTSAPPSNLDFGGYSSEPLKPSEPAGPESEERVYFLPTSTTRPRDPRVRSRETKTLTESVKPAIALPVERPNSPQPNDSIVHSQGNVEPKESWTSPVMDIDTMGYSPNMTESIQALPVVTNSPQHNKFSSISQDPDKSTTYAGYSPESQAPTVSISASLGPSQSLESLEIEGYSPEPMTPAEPEKQATGASFQAWNSLSSTKYDAKEDDDADGIAWGSGSYGSNSNKSYGRGASHGSYGRDRSPHNNTFGDDRSNSSKNIRNRNRSRGRYGDYDKPSSTSNDRSYQFQPHSGNSNSSKFRDKSRSRYGDNGDNGSERGGERYKPYGSRGNNQHDTGVSGSAITTAGSSGYGSSYGRSSADLNDDNSNISWGSGSYGSRSGGGGGGGGNSGYRGNRSDRGGYKGHGGEREGRGGGYDSSLGDRDRNNTSYSSHRGSFGDRGGREGYDGRNQNRHRSKSRHR